MQLGKNHARLLVQFLFIALSAFSIARLFSLFVLNPDSTGYITAAQNFIRTGHMFAYANSPSWSLLPAIEPYTEQPSGFPLFLVPFLIIFKDPVLAAAIAQSSAILILYAAVYVLTRDLGAGPFFQVACGVVFTLFYPLQVVYTAVESETLFIGLTLWAVHFLIASKYSPDQKRYWIGALLCAAAASLTRSVGALMVGVFLLVSWQRVKSRWVSIASSIVCVVGPIVAWALRNQILYGSTSMTHAVNDHITWEKLFPQLVFLLDSTSRQPFIVVLTAGFSLLCLAAPFIGPIYAKTLVIHFKMDLSKVPLVNILLTILGVFVASIALAADSLGFGGDPEIGLKQLAIASLGVLIAIIPWIRNTNLLDFVRSWKDNYDWNRWKTRPVYTFSLLLLAGLSHFGGITVLSLVTPFSDLRNRLLAPSLALLLFSGLAGMYFLTRMLPFKFYPAPIYALASGLIMLSPFFITTGLGFQVGFRRPPEQALWREIYNLPGIAKTSHFYSDYNFTHEIFGNRPQRIILNIDQISQPGFLSSILATGQCPFVLVNHGSEMSRIMDQYYLEANLFKLDMLDGQFELFAQPCLLSP